MRIGVARQLPPAPHHLGEAGQHQHSEEKEGQSPPVRQPVAQEEPKDDELPAEAQFLRLRVERPVVGEERDGGEGKQQPVRQGKRKPLPSAAGGDCNRQYRR